MVQKLLYGVVIKKVVVVVAVEIKPSKYLEIAMKFDVSIYYFCTYRYLLSLFGILLFAWMDLSESIYSRIFDIGGKMVKDIIIMDALDSNCKSLMLEAKHSTSTDAFCYSV